MHLIYAATALRDLEALPHDVRERVLNKIELYTHHENPLGFAKPLSGYNAYRFRIGIHRVIFEIDGETIVILKVTKRDKAYKDL